MPTIMSWVGQKNIKKELLTGREIGGKNFGVHLDGYDQSEILLNQGKSKRKVFYYFNRSNISTNLGEGMNQFFIGLTLVSVLSVVGCTKKSEENSALSESVSAERSAEAGEPATPKAQPVAPNATTPTTVTDSIVSATSTPDDNSSKKEVSNEASFTSDVQENFDAGIAAYQANNLPLAFQEFQTAAKKGHADSQYNLGLMYEQGIGTAKDESQAVTWYREAAAQGNSAAQFNLGVLYENGRGTKVDFAAANKWYRSASVQGDALAIGNLGMLYVRGDGVAENKVAGVALLIMSATMDRSPGNLARRNITSTHGLTGEMIASAQKLSEEMSTAENMLVSLDQFLEQSESKR